MTKAGDTGGEGQSTGRSRFRPAPMLSTRSSDIMMPYRSIIALLTLLFLAAPQRQARAQGAESAGNQYVRASVSTFSGSGRFWITAGPALGGYRFLFGNSFVSSSNLVFRITSGGQTRYFSNIPYEYPYRPILDGGEEIDYKPYDSLYASADTLAVAWRGMLGFNVVMRLIPEKPSGAYQNGSDVRLEFSHEAAPSAPADARLGIFMMLDCYNAQAGPIDGATTITASNEHFPIGRGGRVMRGSDLPAFYHIGAARYGDPLNTVLGVHRLTGTSHDGLPLTAPDFLAVGEWADVLRDDYWEIDSAAVAGTPIVDCATAVRWSGLRGRGIVRTAFGSSDRDGNNFFTCRDSLLFVAVRTLRVVEQFEAGAPYSPSEFDVEAWVANLDADSAFVGTVMLDGPAPSEGLVIDPTTSSAQSISLAPRAVGRLRWRMTIAPDAGVVNANVPLALQFAPAGGGPARPFLDVCAPTVTVRGIARPNQDTMAPTIVRTGSGTAPRHWTFRASDRHPGYDDDKGLDTFRLIAGGTFNMRMVATGLRRCDTSAPMDLRAEVIDTTRPAGLLVAVYDCAGNAAYDTASYRPPPRDTLAPVIVRLDSTRTSWMFRTGDLHPGYQYDTGLDTIRAEAGRLLNMGLTVVPFIRCDTLSTPLITATVVDTTKPAFVVFAVRDCAGNLAYDSASFTPLPAGVAGHDIAGAALGIGDVRPQPLRASKGAVLEAELHNVGPRGADACLISIEGIELVCWTVQAGASALRCPLPASAASGLYILEVRSGAQRAARSVLILR